jgi:hypothetical protein
MKAWQVSRLFMAEHKTKILTCRSLSACSRVPVRSRVVAELTPGDMAVLLMFVKQVTVADLLAGLLQPLLHSSVLTNQSNLKLHQT